MKNDTADKFEGFEFTTSGKDIIAGDVEKLTVYNDGSGLTGDFSEEDNYYNDNMIKLDKELNNILKDA